jgi:hypothetical protein
MSIWGIFFWLLLSVPVLLWLERQIHQRLQETILLVTGHPDIAFVVYVLLFLPGVFLHELSHYLMATILFVRASKFSIWPKRQRNGMLRLGYVETARVDAVREALIGVAPVLFGSAVVLLIGYLVFNVGALGAALSGGRLADVFAAAEGLARVADPWLWLYLLFAVSNQMLPSASDRQAWPVVGLLAVLLAAGVYLLGIGPQLATNLAGPLGYALGLLASAFTITIAIDVPLLVLIWVARGVTTLLTGRRLRYE